MYAQRRPGREPRRHVIGGVPAQANVHRSTKAGARTPATRGTTTPPSWWMRPAQRRPGREPRRHVDESGLARLGRRRSTKAGARTPATHLHTPRSEAPTAPAQRRPGREPRRHSGPPGRSTTCADPLNEGRGANPGDTGHESVGRARDAARSTKAGARTPATLQHAGARGLVLGRRSTKAGARTPATPYRADEDVRRDRRSTKAGARTPATRSQASSGHVSGGGRSTKAGARTPATPVDDDLRAPEGMALNEGRGANPGDTSIRPPPRGPSPPLNEGRGANPGDTRAAGTTRAPPCCRSTKAGARTPATREGETGTRATWEVAQRRPGREPRRHSAR